MLNSLILKPLIYTHHAFRETFRIPRTLITVVIIVCGIAMPLVILKGITDGLVKQQEEDFQKSPSATTIQVAASTTSGPITRTLEQTLLAHPAISSVIPDTTKIVDLSANHGMQNVTGVTVRCTATHDPLLKFYDAQIDLGQEPSIVLNRSLAEELQIPFEERPDQRLDVRGTPRVELVIHRNTDQGIVSETLSVIVSAITDFGTNAPICYLHRDVVAHLEDYQEGRSVDLYGWAGLTKSAPVSFESYLAFSKQPFSTADLLKLHAHGLNAELLESSTSSGEQLRSLYGLLQPHDLFVYRLYADGANLQEDSLPLLTMSTKSVESLTDVDDIIVPWSEPISTKIDGADQVIVGISLHRRWLKSLFLDESSPFRSAAEPFEIHLPTGRTSGLECLLQHGDGEPVPLTVTSSILKPVITSHQSSTPALFAPWKFAAQQTLQQFLPNKSSQKKVIAAKPIASAPLSLNPVAVVPASLLAHLKALDRGEVQFDVAVGRFVPIRSEAEYYQARVVAENIELVPEADAFLSQLGFATVSQRTRVEELLSYAQTLELLVFVVGGTVLFFGFWTLTAALAENTDRKKRSIGVLRVMGIGPLGVAYIVILRGLFIGLVAGAMTIPLAYIAAHLLTEHVAACQVSLLHLQQVFGLAVGACFLGALIPAVLASFISPAEILRESGSI